MPLLRSPCAAATLIAVLCASAACTREPAEPQSVQVEVVAAENLPKPPAASVELVPLTPQLVYSEPLPLPPVHRVWVALQPAGATTLRQVERVEITVDVDGGALGNRDVSVVFASPAGPVWERQVRRGDKKAGETLTLTFSLPVAATLIEDQGLSGRWTLTTLDDGAPLATAGFTLAP